MVFSLFELEKGCELLFTKIFPQPFSLFELEKGCGKILVKRSSQLA